MNRIHATYALRRLRGGTVRAGLMARDAFPPSQGGID